MIHVLRCYVTSQEIYKLSKIEVHREISHFTYNLKHKVRLKKKMEDFSVKPLTLSLNLQAGVGRKRL